MKVVVKTNFGTPSSRRALRMCTKVKTRVSRVSREQKTGVLSKRNVVVCSASATKGMFVQLGCGPVKMHVFPRESRETKVELFAHYTSIHVKHHRKYFH